jgi:hypothetical protein
VKGTHLVRVAKAQGRFPLPLEGARVETLRLLEPLECSGATSVLYVCLEGEVVIDIGLQYVHLRALEAFTVTEAHRISAVVEAIVLRITIPQ